MVRFFTSFSAQPRLAVVTTTLEVLDADERVALTVQEMNGNDPMFMFSFEHGSDLVVRCACILYTVCCILYLHLPKLLRNPFYS